MSWHLQPEYTLGARGQGCSFCGLPKVKGQDKVLVSDVRIKYEGRIEICPNCVGEAAKLLGYLSPSKTEKLKIEQVELQKEASDLRQELELLSGVLASIQAYNDSVSDTESSVTSE